MGKYLNPFAKKRACRFEESGNIDFLSLILLLKRLGMTPLEFMQYCTDFEIGDSDYCLK